MEQKADNTNQILGTNRAVTEIMVEKASFTWTITNFIACRKKVGGKLDSPSFLTTIGNNEYKWHLQIYPYGQVLEEIETYVSLYLYLDSSEGIEVSGTFTILNPSSSLWGVFYQEHFGTEKFVQNYSYGYLRFQDRSTFLTYIESGSIIIRCDIYKHIDTISYSNQKQVLEKTTLMHQLIDDMETLWKNEHLSDITLYVQGKEFKVHKAILGARSTVFAAMFTHKMIETQKAAVEISDIKAEVMEEVLRFVYTGKVNSIDKIASELLIASNKYNIQSLKAECENFLCISLSLDNVLDLLSLADVHQADTLKKEALRFTALYASSLIDKQQFFIFKKSNPHLVLEAFSILSKMK